MTVKDEFLRVMCSSIAEGKVHGYMDVHCLEDLREHIACMGDEELEAVACMLDRCFERGLDCDFRCKEGLK